MILAGNGKVGDLVWPLHVTCHCKTFSIELIDAWIMLVPLRTVIIERKEEDSIICINQSIHNHLAVRTDTAPHSCISNKSRELESSREMRTRISSTRRHAAVEALEFKLVGASCRAVIV